MHVSSVKSTEYDVNQCRTGSYLIQSNQIWKPLIIFRVPGIEKNDMKLTDESFIFVPFFY